MVYRKYLHLNYKVYEINILDMLKKKRKIAYRIISLYHVGRRWLTGKMVADTFRSLLSIKGEE